MNARWPNAFVLSTTLHLGVVGVALWIGYSVVQEPEPRREISQLVSSTASLWGGGAEEATTRPASIRFTAPRPVPVRRTETEVADPESLPAPVTRHSIHPTPNPARTTTVSPGAPTRMATRPPAAKPAGAGPARSQTARPYTPVNGSDLANTLRQEAAQNIPDSTGLAEQISYRALIENSLREALERVPGLDADLSAEAEFRVLPNGHARAARLTQRSGDERFDAAVLEAITSLALPPRPPGFDELQRVPFRTHARR